MDLAAWMGIYSSRDCFFLQDDLTHMRVNMLKMFVLLKAMEFITFDEDKCHDKDHCSNK